MQAPLATGITDDVFRAAAGCSNCTVTARSSIHLPLTGKVLTEVKLMSPSSPTAYGAALDGQGNVVDPRALLTAEGAAKIRRQGKLRDDVYARSLTSSSELVPISIWADFVDGHAPRQQVISDSTFRASRQAQTASRLHTVTSKISAWLDARGFRTHERGTDSPVITADVPANALDALGHLDGVAIVHLTYPEVPAGFAWFDAVKGPAAQLVVSSVVEGLTYCNGEGWQPDDYSYLTPYQVFDSTAQSNLHTRWTSELISATASPRMAPGASLYVAGWNNTPSTKYAAWQACYSLGIHSMNRSASTGTGSIGLLAEDMAQDFYAYNWPYPLITLSAGNCEVDGVLKFCSQTPGQTNVTNRSYNTLVVGASDDNDTAATSDDSLASFSQYTNPVTTHSDFELPNLVAPGSSGYTAGVGAASTIGRGTSGSAPIVLGTALLMKTRDWGFNFWPEMVRATLMAASTHPVNGVRTVRVDTGTDGTQGAGLLNAAVAVDLANPSLYTWGTNNPGTPKGRDSHCVNFSTDFPGGRHGPYNVVPAINGRLRVVAAWDATAQGCSTVNGSGCTGDIIDADLDLFVLRWSGSSYVPVCWSQSYDSSWELCDLAVNAGELYKVELGISSTNTTGTCLGIAWNNYDPNAE